MPSQFSSRSTYTGTRSLPYATYAGRGQAPRRRSQTTRQSEAPRMQWSKGRILLAVIVFLFISAHMSWTKHVAAEKAASQAAHAKLVADHTTLLTQQINGLIASSPQLSLSIATVSSQQDLRTYGESTTFDGASTGKLLTAADYLHRVDQGRASLNQSIGGQSARSLLQAMLVDSDDNAWETLNDYLTHREMLDYASDIGFTNYDPATNTFTARDVAVLLQKLYNGNLLSATSRGVMLGYLSQANYRSYIVPAVAKNNQVYHKVGINNDAVNDAAIITSGKDWLVLVVFSDGHDTYNWLQRAHLMQSITRDTQAAYLSPAVTQGS